MLRPRLMHLCSVDVGLVCLVRMLFCQYLYSSSSWHCALPFIYNRSFLPGHLEIPFDSITDQEWIGSGSQGAVYLGRYNNCCVAVKKVKRQDEALKAAEICKLKHENIVSFMWAEIRYPPVWCCFANFDERIISAAYVLNRRRVTVSWWSIAGKDPFTRYCIADASSPQICCWTGPGTSHMACRICISIKSFTETLNRQSTVAVCAM